MTVPVEDARELARQLRSTQLELRQMRARWDAAKRVVLGAWKRGMKMPYEVVRPFIDGGEPSRVISASQEDEETQEGPE